MYVHQYTKGQLNWSTDGTVIGTNVHTHAPLHKLHFTTNLCISYLYIYLHICSTYCVRVNENSLKFTDLISPINSLLKYLIHTKLNAYNILSKVNLWSVFHTLQKLPATERFHQCIILTQFFTFLIAVYPLKSVINSL